MAGINIERNEFFSGLQSRLGVIRHYREKLNRGLAMEFNLVNFLRPDEYRLSELIALLLDPGGAHGQGSVFLQIFLQRLKDIQVSAAISDEISRGQSVHVTLEQPTHVGRRIDIVVSAGQVGFGIENKPWAQDQKDQLVDYADYLEKRFRKTWALIYLRGYAGPPSESSLSGELRKRLVDQHNYIEWSYWLDLTGWLETCIEKCEAEKVRWLLRDFRAYVRSNFVLAGGKESQNVG